MVALQARQFVQTGLGVLVVDLFGTGDSAGDFGDARWSIWLDDLRRGAQWLFEHGFDRIVLWGLRSGALLASELARELKDRIAQMVFWQPVVRGEQMMTQFLRLRLAADMMGAGEKMTTQQLRETLYAGSAVEIAGYTLAPELVRAIDAAELKKLIQAGTPQINWFEVAPAARNISPVSQKIVDVWRSEGIRVDAVAMVGEPFWNSPEIGIVSELIAQSTSCLLQGAP